MTKRSRQRPPVLAFALLSCVACTSSPGPRARQPPPEPEPVPDVIAFMPVDTQIAAHLDVAAMMSMSGMELVREQVTAMAAYLPGCDVGLLDQISTITIAVRDRQDDTIPVSEALVIRVTGDMSRSWLTSCAREVSRLAGEFSIREIAGGLSVVSSDGRELVQIRWTEDGLLVGGDVAYRAGPGEPQLDLLGRVELNSPFWGTVVSSPSVPKNAERMLFELRTDATHVLFRCAARFKTAAYAEQGTEDFISGLQQGVANAGYAAQIPLIMEGITSSVDGRWSRVELSLSIERLVEIFGATEESY